MSEIILTRALSARGFDNDELVRQQRTGDLRRIRRGAYAKDAGRLTPDRVAAHRELIAATVPQLKAGAVISHLSAAVLHGLPVLPQPLPAVHITRPRSGGGGKSRSFIRLHAQPLAAADITEVEGVPVTSLERTVFDIARRCSLDQAVAAGDRALSVGLDPGLLAEMLERGSRWVGIRQARRVLDFIDAGAESPGESVSRVRIDQLGLPAPRLQYPVLLRDGRTVYGDFAWPELGTIGEFDGLVKYGVLLRPGETPADAVVREKRREDALREMGWQIVRWIWSDLAAFGPTRDRLDAAFARGSRSRTLL